MKNGLFYFIQRLGYSSYTLVTQIIVQQALSNFRNFPNCKPLFQPAPLSNFEICKQKQSFIVIKLQPAQPYSILHFYYQILKTFTIIPTCTIIQETKCTRLFMKVHYSPLRLWFLLQYLLSKLELGCCVTYADVVDVAFSLVALYYFPV